jgi:multiple sugar transport system substrate-binding protein
VLIVLLMISSSTAVYYASMKPSEVTVTTTVTGTQTMSELSFEDQARAAFPKAEDAQIDWQQFAGTNLNFMFVSHPWQAAISPYIPEFEKLTGMTVNLEVVDEGSYWDRVVLGLQSKEPVFDLTFVSQGADTYSYYKNGWLVNVDQFLANSSLTDQSWYDQGDMYPAMLQVFKMPDGKMYGIPITFEVYMMFYRKDLFQQYNIDVPTTMDGWLSAIERFQSMSSTTGVYGAVIRGGSQTGISDEINGMLLDYWGDRPVDPARFILFDQNWTPTYTDPAIIQGMNTWATVMKNGPPGITSYDWSEATTAFAQGKAATYWFDASLFRGTFEDPTQSKVVGKVGYAVVPPAPTGGHRTVLWCWGLGIPTNSQHQAAAWLFLEWVTSKLQNVLTGVKTSAATRQSAWAFPPMVSSFQEGFATAVAQSLAIASPDNIYYAQYDEIVMKQNDALHAIYLGQKTAEQAVGVDLQAQVIQILKDHPPT